ncbi:putative T7SS-secreted protein [Streptomyces sp. NPDC050164]|uniref:putative T7SS-secreted protein n=1 Tax=Streptomyces sp. NPDC050164 TaxID=3365605 RepID=UPI003789403B
MTYTPGTERSGAAPDPQSRSDLSKPQGLKSAPDIPYPHYPHLGFNPVPGDTETVRGLHKKLSGCAKVIQDAHDLVTKLLDGSYWEGDAAVAFREQLDGGPLPLNLKNAAHSIRKAARQLARWEGEIDDFQRRAKRLEEDAKEAQAAVDRAHGRASAAKDSPDLHEKGTDRDAAQKALTRANSAVEEAQAELDKIIGKAKKLAEEHEHQAAYRAGKIRDATKKLAPQEPGWFDKTLDWLGDNLPDILSFTAGLIAVAALLLAGPLGWSLATVAGLMLTSSAISLTAFSLRISDAETWASLKDGFTKQEFDADFWSNLVSVGAVFRCNPCCRCAPTCRTLTASAWPSSQSAQRLPLIARSTARFSDRSPSRSASIIPWKQTRSENAIWNVNGRSPPARCVTNSSHRSRPPRTHAAHPLLVHDGKS